MKLSELCAIVVLTAAILLRTDAKTIATQPNPPAPAENQSKVLYTGEETTKYNNGNPNIQFSKQFSMKSSNSLQPAAPQSKLTSYPQPNGEFQQSIEYQQQSPSSSSSKDYLQNKDFQQPITATDYSSNHNDHKINEFKSDLNSLKENLKFLADTQRILLESMQTQQQHHMTDDNSGNSHYQHKIEPTFEYGPKYEENDLGSQNHDLSAPTINNYYPPAAPAYAPMPPLPALPYGDDTYSNGKPPHRHSYKAHTKPQKKQQRRGRLQPKGTAAVESTKKKVFGRGLLRRGLLRRGLRRRGQRRGLRTSQFQTDRKAHQTLSIIKNGVKDAILTAVIVLVVKLTPLLVMAFKVFFHTVAPFGDDDFGERRGLLFQDDFNLDELLGRLNQNDLTDLGETDVPDELDDDQQQIEQQDEVEQDEELDDDPIDGGGLL